MAFSFIRATTVMALATLPVLGAAGAHASPFTGPNGYYYLDNYDTQSIYVVHGASVVASFPWAYGTGNNADYNEANLAIANGVVTTNGFGSSFGGPATGGRYTLTGTPTGVGHVAQATPGYSVEQQYDGTSDGTHNYTVQYTALDGSSHYAEYVVQTDLDWQNPVALFPVAPGGVYGSYLGITYDPTNNSLWVSGWQTTTIADFSLSGTLLSSFDTQESSLGTLALDPTDDTLWVSVDEANALQQWSKSGTLLQYGVPTGLPDCCYLAGEMTPTPEPATLALFGVGLIGLGLARRRL